MDYIFEHMTGIWIFLNKPFIVLGKSSITLSWVVLNILFLFTFLFILTKLKNIIIRNIVSKSDANINNWRAVITISYYVILVIGLIALLQASGLDLSLFTVLTGAIGIGVGFGMQTIFSNFISGIIILLEKPIKIGDRVEVDDIYGNVQNISVRATTILTNDDVSVIVPNSDFISKQVINWSHSGRNVRTSVSVSVDYNSDPEIVKKLLLEVAADTNEVLKSPTPMVRLSEFGDSGLKFSLLVWTQEYSDRIGALKSILNFKILKSLQDHHIEIPYPKRVIYVHNIETKSIPEIL